MTALTAALWFFGGAVAWSFLTRVLRNYYLINELSLTTAKMVVALTGFEDSFTQEQKEKIIKGLIDLWPKQFRKALAFNNWDEAMRWAKKIKG